MTTSIDIYDENFKKTSSTNVDVDLSPEKINVPVVHQVVKATLAGRRSGTASTRNRALTRGGGKKPFKQKGTGRARQGSSRSPLNVGGGTTFGPTPRDFTQKVNKKVMIRAIQSVLADKVKEGKLFVVDKFPAEAKTSQLAKTFSSNGIDSALVVSNEPNNSYIRAARNLERGKGLPVQGFSVYEAVKFRNVVIEKEAFEKLVNRISSL